MTVLFKGVLNHTLNPHNLYGPKHMSTIRDLNWLLAQIEDTASDEDLTGIELAMLIQTSEQLHLKIQCLKLSYEWKYQDPKNNNVITYEEAENKMMKTEEKAQLEKLMRSIIILHMQILTSTETTRNRRQTLLKVRGLYQQSREMYEKLNQKKHMEYKALMKSTTRSMREDIKGKGNDSTLNIIIRKMECCKMELSDLCDDILKQLKEDLQFSKTNWEGSSINSDNRGKAKIEYGVEECTLDQKKYFVGLITEILDMKNEVECISDTIGTMTIW